MIMTRNRGSISRPKFFLFFTSVVILGVASLFSQQYYYINTDEHVSIIYTTSTEDDNRRGDNNGSDDGNDVNHGNHVQKVYIIDTTPKDKHNSRMQHIFLDGLERSHKLQHTMDVKDTSAYWIIDLTYPLSSDLVTLTKNLELSGRTKNKKWGGNSNSTSSSPSSKIIFLDMTDRGYHYKNMLALQEAAIPYFGEGNVYYAARQLTEGRHITFHSIQKQGKGSMNKDVYDVFNESSIFSEMGSRSTTGPMAEAYAKFGMPVGVLRYGVRSDTVERIKVLLGRINENKNDTLKQDYLHFLPELDRSLDVASFVNIDLPWKKPSLRKVVGRTVQSLSSSDMNITAHQHLSVTVKIVGENAAEGRKGVTDEYTQALMDHKIIVVAQRDLWEGHYRLMEALAGGALVMTDPMHPLPYKLVDGDGIVVYSSLKDLKEKIVYYINNPSERLQIAKRGYYVAMNYHRSWHIMERLLLGNWTENNVY